MNKCNKQILNKRNKENTAKQMKRISTTFQRIVTLDYCVLYKYPYILTYLLTYLTWVIVCFTLSVDKAISPISNQIFNKIYAKVYTYFSI